MSISAHVSPSTDGSVGTSTVYLAPSAWSPVVSRLPIALHVRKRRLVIVACIVVGLLLVAIQLLHHGVVIATGNADFRDPMRRQQREDDLNFYVGTIASLLAKIVELATMLMLPIVVLVLLTEHSMLNDSLPWRVGVLLSQGCFIALLTNAFSTTYVTSPGPQIVHRIMTEQDLVTVMPSVAANGLNMSSVDPTVPRRQSTETMLRTAMLPPHAKPSRRSRCTEGWRNQSIAARFGFYTNDGLRQLASNGIELNGSLNFSVSEWLTSTPLTSSHRMPHNLTTAANLAIHAMNFLVDRLQMPLLSASTVDPLQVYARQARLVNNTNEFLQITANMVNTSLALQAEFGFFFAPERASLQFSTHARGSIVFDAVTMTLPFQSGLLQRSLVPTQFDTLRDDKTLDPFVDGDLVDANGDIVYQVFPTDECGTRGCWLTKPATSREADTLWRLRPEVVAYSRCRATFESIGASDAAFTACPDDQIVNHSIVIGSIGSMLLADRVVEFESPGFTATSARVRRANVTNLERTLSITVAFLTWQIQDLSRLYNVDCAPNTSTRCYGLWYPVTQNSDVLVDAHRLIADELNPIASTILAGQPLASIVTDIPGGSFLAFQNVRDGISQVAPNKTMFAIDPSDSNTQWLCSRDMETIADSIVFNHWYIDHSFQEAYTAGLFHVFQFGVLHAINFSLERDPTVKAIDLVGNVVAFSFIAHIPFKGAMVSLLAGALFLVSIVVVACTGKRRECAIRDVTDVHRVARVHLVDQFFPKFFLNLHTDHGQSLEPFRIVAMQLYYPRPDGDLYVTLPGPIDSTSMIFDPSDREQGHAFEFRPISSPRTLWSESTN